MKIRNIILYFLLLGSVITLIGCNKIATEKSKENDCNVNTVSSKALDDGKLALANQEYDKALSLFKLAIDEGCNDDTCNTYYDLTNNVIILQNSISSCDLEQCKLAIETLENNSKLDIISEAFEKLKDSYDTLNKNYLQYDNQVTAIEELYTNKNYDKAYSTAKELITNLDNYKSLKDRLDSIINNIDTKITNAHDCICNYISNSFNTTNFVDIKYKDVSYWTPNPKTMEEKPYIRFSAVGNCEVSSHDEYFFDEDTNNIYKLNQGIVFLVNNNNELINDPNKKDSIINVSSDQAVEIAKHNYTNDTIEIDATYVPTYDDTTNEYLICVTPKKSLYPYMEYKVNAETGTCVIYK